jgi:hypothetical protein
MVGRRDNSALLPYCARMLVHFIVAEELAAQLDRAQARRFNNHGKCLASEALPVVEGKVNSP